MADSSDVDTGLVEVIPSLYISSLKPASSVDILYQNRITHVLAVGLNMQSPFPNLCKYKIVSLEDSAEANLLECLPSAIEYISQAISKDGRVLVHCVAGISRSASIIVAYLMKAQKLEYEQALEILHQQHPRAEPNSGFEEQLRLFAELNYVVDLEETRYRRFLMTRMAQQRDKLGYIPQLVLGCDPLKDAPIAGVPSITGGVQPIPRTGIRILQLRCKKCRRILVSKDNIMEHNPGAGETSFAYNKRGQGLGPNAQAKSKCNLFFIEPMEWIHGLDDGSVEGKIQCPKCESKLGSYNWSGSQCSCGEWITPSFALQKSKVDEVTGPCP
ncbi:protein-tyrosine phosphatase-like protein [Polychytrium aggregatum]|uniref:protein-tyrosine phosphatase-like protein n=1 Tax=Polychytrium aggregatum TaxID=110093 RepID=UPI0022FDB3D8|nr:protein-tyrosine phosphatase-like protein [Polychytrium aggregatum]KAI9209360.1 protein-tyrosine phosphatase-like protein [Polychytrium aggregatum]